MLTFSSPGSTIYLSYSRTLRGGAGSNEKIIMLLPPGFCEEVSIFSFSLDPLTFPDVVWHSGPDPKPH